MSRKFFKLLRSRKLQYSANVRDKIINKAAHPRIDSLNIELKFWASVLDSRLFLPLFEKRIDSEARQVAISVSENSDPIEVEYRFHQVKRTLRQLPKYSLEARLSNFLSNTREPRAIGLIEDLQVVYRDHVADVLAVGCRDIKELKMLKRKLPESRVIGLDLVSSDESIIAGDLQALNMESNLFDLVVASHVLEHIAEPRNAAKECFRILRPGGVLAIEVPTTKHAQNCVIRWQPLNDIDLWDFGTAETWAKMLDEVSENQLLRLLVKDGPSISRVIVVKENEKKGNQEWA